jgi:Tol biopolymer transport system component
MTEYHGAVILVRSILSIIIISLLLLIILASGCSKTYSPEPDPLGYPYLDEFPAPSPDGTWVIYYHRGIVEFAEHGYYRIDPDSAGLWMVNIDGSNPHIILNARDVFAQWSPDGEWIVFHLNTQIYKARISGDHLDTLSIQQLTSGDRNFHPSWNSDGEWISYESNVAYPGTFLFDIWKMKSDGSQKTNIREHSRYSHWSPRGDKIAHIYLGDGKREILTIDVSDGKLTQVTTGGKWNTYPRYSPDGTRIVFSVGSSIFTVKDNGEELNGVFNGGGYPSWLAGGDQIIFSKSDLSNVRNHGTIWIMNIDGTDLRQLTHGLSTGCPRAAICHSSRPTQYGFTIPTTASGSSGQ